MLVLRASTAYLIPITEYASGLPGTACCHCVSCSFKGTVASCGCQTKIDLQVYVNNSWKETPTIGSEGLVVFANLHPAPRLPISLSGGSQPNERLIIADVGSA
eukprot:4430140-Amphidinium_carterae.1